MPTIHLLIKGKVQGVFFRATAKNEAEKADIKGWVRNTKEGDVEIMASGKEERLSGFVDWCKRGPKRALVAEVLVNPIEETSFHRFEIRREQEL